MAGCVSVVAQQSQYQLNHSLYVEWNSALFTQFVVLFKKLGSRLCLLPRTRWINHPLTDVPYCEWHVVQRGPSTQDTTGKYSVCAPVSMDKSGAAGDSQSFGHVLYAGSLSRPLKACRSGTNSVPILLLVQSFLTESWAEGIWEEEAIQLNICMWQNKSSNWITYGMLRLNRELIKNIVPKHSYCMNDVNR